MLTFNRFFNFYFHGCSLLKKRPFGFVFSIFLLFGVFSTTFGLMMSSGVGVSTGDTFSYTYACYFLSDNSSATLPQEFAWINQTDYFMMKVTSISGSTINFETTLHMRNGSDMVGIGAMNVGSGMSSMNGYSPIGMGSYYFISSNVGMMGRMFPSASFSPTVNDTSMMNYVRGQRLTTTYQSLRIRAE